MRPETRKRASGGGSGREFRALQGAGRQRVDHLSDWQSGLGAFYYVDPDEDAVELQCDVFGDWAQSNVFGDWAQSNEFMRTSPQFAADPIGTLVDPDRVLAARDAGATAAEVHRRAYSGEFSPDVPPDLRLPAPPAD